MARGLPTGGQCSKVYVLCAEPKEHKHFHPGTRPGGSGTRPGGSVTGVTEKLFLCQMFMCLFRPLDRRGCQASQKKGLTSGEVRGASRGVRGTSGEVWETSGEPMDCC